MVVKETKGREQEESWCETESMGGEAVAAGGDNAEDKGEDDDVEAGGQDKENGFTVTTTASA